MPFKKHSCLFCSPAIIFYKNFLQHFISKALILCKVVFPSVHVSQPYMQLRGKHMFCEFLVLLEDPDHSARISTSTACLLLQQAFSLFPPTHLHLQILWIPDKHIWEPIPRFHLLLILLFCNIPLFASRHKHGLLCF